MTTHSSDKTAHTHKYEDIGLARITQVTNVNYNGTAGDKAFLMRVCGCGDMRAFEYGDTASMESLKQTLAVSKALEGAK